MYYKIFFKSFDRLKQFNMQVKSPPLLDSPRISQNDDFQQHFLPGSHVSTAAKTTKIIQNFLTSVICVRIPHSKVERIDQSGFHALHQRFDGFSFLSCDFSAAGRRKKNHEEPITAPSALPFSVFLTGTRI